MHLSTALLAWGTGVLLLAVGIDAAGHCTEGGPFDFLFLVEFWAPTQCGLFGCTGAPESFTIHGTKHL